MLEILTALSMYLSNSGLVKEAPLAYHTAPGTVKNIPLAGPFDYGPSNHGPVVLFEEDFGPTR